ncbi:ATP-binding domain-containing protein, partial [Bacteroidales bacterium OttesenSCG-928-L03]|nr:ATP-binding domain-containing protein [Bacteroidales bacterium OttesenSCG-928-L03]
VYNNGIRNRILDREEELEGGDILMVAKNNYFWSKEEKAMDFIANGDMMRIRRVRRVEEMYGFRFADVTVLFPDYDLEMDIKILLNTLNVDSPSLPKEANDQLFYTILEDYADIPDRRGKMKKMKEDPYYNAVQVKYGYAVTGHKAQGGQWKTVFLDISFVPEEFLGIDFYRWLYTAITRATDRLYLVNPPQEFLESPS